MLGLRSRTNQRICSRKYQTRSRYTSWFLTFLPFFHLHLTTKTDKTLPCHPPLLNSCGKRVSDLITHFNSLLLRLVISSLEPCNISGLQIKTHSLDTSVTELQCSAAGIFQVNSLLQHKPYIEAKCSSLTSSLQVALTDFGFYDFPPVNLSKFSVLIFNWSLLWDNTILKELLERYFFIYRPFNIGCSWVVSEHRQPVHLEHLVTP